MNDQQVRHYLARLINRLPVVCADGTPEEVYSLMVEIRWYTHEVAVRKGIGNV